MGESADELRRDIEETRGGLTETLDAIGDRVSPGRVIERRKNRMVQSVQSVRDRVMGSAATPATASPAAPARAVDTVKGAPDLVRQQTQGSPSPPAPSPSGSASSSPRSSRPASPSSTPPRA